MENNNKTKIENNMENRTLTEIVEDYKNSTNEDIKNDFFKCCRYLNKHQEEVTREEYLEMVEMVYKHYLKQVTKNKLPFKTYIPSDWKIVKPFKEELVKLEENNGNPTSIEYSSIIGKYDPYTEVNMVYLVELYKYRYNKKNGIKNKYLNDESSNTNTKPLPIDISSKLEYFIEQLNGCGNLDELLQKYDSTIKEVCSIINDEVENSDAKQEAKAKIKQNLFGKYKNVFNEQLHKFEANITFKNQYYTIHIPTEQCVHEMMFTLKTNDVDEAINLVEDIFDVINYRMKTHRNTIDIAKKCIGITMQFQEVIIDLGLTPIDAVKYVTNPKFRAEYDKEKEKEYKEVMSSTE